MCWLNSSPPYFSARKHKESKFSRVSVSPHVLPGTLSGEPDCLAGSRQGESPAVLLPGLHSEMGLGTVVGAEQIAFLLITCSSPQLPSVHSVSVGSTGALPLSWAIHLTPPHNYCCWRTEPPLVLFWICSYIHCLWTCLILLRNHRYSLPPASSPLQPDPPIYMGNRSALTYLFHQVPSCFTPKQSPSFSGLLGGDTPPLDHLRVRRAAVSIHPSADSHIKFLLRTPNVGTQELWTATVATEHNCITLNSRTRCNCQFQFLPHGVYLFLSMLGENHMLLFFPQAQANEVFLELLSMSFQSWKTWSFDI